MSSQRVARIACMSTWFGKVGVLIRGHRLPSFLDRTGADLGPFYHLFLSYTPTTGQFPNTMDPARTSDVVRQNVLVDEKGQTGIDKPRDFANIPEADESNTGGLAGVEKVQGLTQTWTKPWLLATYVL